jgi:hypothetical protein
MKIKHYLVTVLIIIEDDGSRQREGRVLYGIDGAVASVAHIVVVLWAIVVVVLAAAAVAEVVEAVMFKQTNQIVVNNNEAYQKANRTLNDTSLDASWCWSSWRLKSL